MGTLRIHPRLANWLVIERAQMMAWWFAVGLLASLVAIVATRDVAFGWSTTLAITPESFHRWLDAIAWPWRGWLPSAVPSAELVEQSQHYRLGGTLEREMVQHAAMLGSWWRFLAMATLVYAVGLRGVMWLGARMGLHRAIRQAMLTTEGVDRLLWEMNTPLVTTASVEAEPEFVPRAEGYGRSIAVIEGEYDAALGWAMDTEEMRVMLDALRLHTRHIENVGGANTLDADAAILDVITGNVVLLVKSWEPPTLDCIDFVIALAEKVDRVVVVPVGLPDAGYTPREQDQAIWSRKLREIDHPKVWLWKN
jgi:hypothetical protein